MSAPGHSHLLLVDDEPAVLLTFRLILEQHGYEVSVADSSRQAQEALARRSYDLLICDLAMERTDSGFDVIAAARRRYPGLPCILLTGYATAELDEEAARRRLRVLFKPVAIPELLAAIRDALQSSSPNAESA